MKLINAFSILLISTHHQIYEECSRSPHNKDALDWGNSLLIIGAIGTIMSIYFCYSGARNHRCEFFSGLGLCAISMWSLVLGAEIVKEKQFICTF